MYDEGSMQWMVTPTDEAVHVTPIGDLRPHLLMTGCWCSPVFDADQPQVLVHASLDGREAFERGERMMS